MYPMWKARWLPPRYMHCLERGHVKDVCPDLLDEEREVLLKPGKELDGRNKGGKTCRRCGSEYHLKNQIPGCNVCHSCDHDGETNCLKNIYGICKETATYKTQDALSVRLVASVAVTTVLVTAKSRRVAPCTPSIQLRT
jgi:hypothetical protein